jgi:hypothetical protein
MAEKLAGVTDNDLRIIKNVGPQFVWLADRISNVFHLLPSFGVDYDSLSLERLDVRDVPDVLMLQENSNPGLRTENLDRCLDQVVDAIKSTKSLQSLKMVCIRNERGEYTGLSRRVDIPQVE